MRVARIPVALALPVVAHAQKAAKPAAPAPLTTARGEWPSYTGDTRGSRYSPLEQINAKNFSTL